MKAKSIIVLLVLALTYPAATWSTEADRPKELPIALNPPTSMPNTEDGCIDDSYEVLAYISADRQSLTIVFPQDEGMVYVELLDFDGSSVYLRRI